MQRCREPPAAPASVSQSDCPSSRARALHDRRAGRLHATEDRVRVRPPHQRTTNCCERAPCATRPLLISPHSQPTAYCSHATQPTVPSAKRSQSAPGVCRRSARVGGSGASLWAAHPHARLGRAGRARGVSRARRSCGSRRGSPQPGSRAAAPAGAQPPPPPRAAAGCCPTPRNPRIITLQRNENTDGPRTPYSCQAVSYGRTGG